MNWTRQSASRPGWQILTSLPVFFAIMSMQSCAAYSNPENLLGLLLIPPPSTANPGFTSSYQTGLLVSESGSTSSLTLALSSAPGADVVIRPGSSDDTEGTVSPASLVFTAANWANPQTITVTGVDDTITDGNQFFSILLGNAESVDTGYNGRNAGTIPVLNVDNENSGVTMYPTSGLVTSETGTTDTFLVMLNTQPTSNVVLSVNSSSATEGSPAPASLTFTSANWFVPQTVTMTGVDDNIADGTQSYSASLTITSGAAPYNPAAVPGSVSISNSDNDTPGISVTNTTGLTTTEGGGTAFFTVVLNSQPTANVTLNLSSSDLTEGSVPAAITFTAANWNVPQNVTVTGVDDFEDDRNQNYQVQVASVTSADANYNGLSLSSISLSNIDDDTYGITVTPSATPVITTESAGTGTFTVVLNSKPTASVVIGLSSDNTLEGTVSPASLTFTTANWNVAQTVTITGVDDAIPVADGAIDYTIITAAATSTDSDYSGLNPADVSARNANNDTVAFVVSTPNTLITTEGGGTTSFNVRLATQPAGDVTLGTAGNLIRSLDTTEGTVSPSTLTFTNANWNVNQTVTITGAADALTDVDQSYQIDLGIGSSVVDPLYNGLNPPDGNGGTAGDLNVNNCDTNGAKVNICLAPGVSALTTTEGGGTARFYLTLRQAPTADLTVNMSSNDLTEVSVPASVTITMANWNAITAVTLTGVDDYEDDGNIATSVNIAPLASTDGFYNTADPADPAVTNTDNDTSGYTISAISGNTTEFGGTATFTVKLKSRPTADVTLPIESNTNSEGLVTAGSSLTFSATVGACGGGGDWCNNQTVTVTGQNDALFDGNVAYQIVTGPGTSSSADGNYNGNSPVNVNVTNTDNDRRIFISTNTHNGNFDGDATLAIGPLTPTTSNGNGIEEADNFCNQAANGYPGSGVYRALLIDGTNRSTATAWILQPNYSYYRLDSTFIGTTTAGSVFNFPLTAAFGLAGTPWTGMDVAWASGNDCLDWANATVGQNGATSDASLTSSGSIFSLDATCDNVRHLICVEQ
ncbi:MAG: DUF1554 domain-containing protein [Leptospiraceae bacterium]|nr:DUF1554 domain-containing protein [Leptospiraceae bacterium]